MLDAQKIISDALILARKILSEQPLEAEILLKQLLRACPDHPEGLGLLGIVKQKTQEFEESIEILNKAISLNPDNSDNYNNLALSYANLDQYDKSIEYLNKALELKPDSYLYINNLALQYRQIWKHDIAIDLLNKALKIKEAAEIFCNLGGVYGELKDLEKAEIAFKRAIEIDPNCYAGWVDLAFTYHLQGRWKDGFGCYEHRFQHFPQLKHYLKAYDQSKKWNGQDLTSKTLLLYCEQGCGDTIQFLRYVPYLKGNVIIHCDKSLETIAQRFGQTISVPINGQLPEYDYQCSLMSLPYLLKIYEISGESYIKSKVKFELENYKNVMKIGIAWAGSVSHPNDLARSTYLKNFKAIHDLPNVKLFSLQVNHSKRVYAAGKRIIDFSEGCEDMKVVDTSEYIKTFEDTANILTGLNLVISVDTSVVHLAGSMGIPTYLLLAYNNDWRWKSEGYRTEWYDSLKIFRQERPNSWDSVFDKVIEELQNEDILQNL